MFPLVCCTASTKTGSEHLETFLELGHCFTTLAVFHLYQLIFAAYYKGIGLQHVGKRKPGLSPYIEK